MRRCGFCAAGGFSINSVSDRLEEAHRLTLTKRYLVPIAADWSKLLGRKTIPKLSAPFPIDL